MNRPADRLPQSIYYLASGLLFGAVFLRSIIIYRGSPVLAPALGLLAVMLALFLSQPAISQLWSPHLAVYLFCQTVLVFVLLSLPGFPDFYATLLLVLSMQAMLGLHPRIGALWIALCAPILVLLLENAYGAFQAVALALNYTAGNAFLGTFTLAMRRAQAARLQNTALARELQGANQQLHAYATRLEGLAIARERNRLARELHDSVTQTVFSMTLATQSALLLLERDPSRVGVHLERLGQLARGALSEMQVLIAELGPDKAAAGGLVSALRQHLAGSRLPESLSVSLHVEGDRPLELEEEQSLFHIAEEALNNIVKHAQTSQAQVRLHLDEPCWMEIEDMGQGFDLRQVQDSNRVGLASMRERAEEIGWDFQIVSAPGAGTRIRVEKTPVGEGQG